jgi:hypothetical protein
MRRTIANIFWLGTKELRSFGHDFVLVALVIWAFSFSIITIARSNLQELHDASIGIADEDQSELSRRITRAFLLPYFKAPRSISERDIEPLMNTGELTFAIDIRSIFSGPRRGASPDPTLRGCHRDDAGRDRGRLRPADHHQGGGELSIPLRAVSPELVKLDVRIALQSKSHVGVVHQRNGDHQQCDDARDHSGRRCDRSRA